jgi:hypothetical protein
MKKVSIITILDVTNIGTYLQAYALGKVLERQGAAVEYVNYIRPVSSWHQIATRRLQKNGGGLKGLGAVVYGLMVDAFSLRRCKSFLTDRIKVTKKYRSFVELKESPPQADIYLTGSDQVWNPVHNHGLDPSFFLDYANDKAPRVAYAASIGSDHIPESIREEMLGLLKKYDRISTREASGAKLLEQEGIENVVTVLDPTLLFDRDMWAEVAKDARFIKTEPYLLVYSVERGRKSLVSEVANRVAAERGLKIYFVTPRWFSSSVRCDRKFYFSTPLGFLALFLNADFAVVSSFHGTAFSVNFNVPFVSVIPDHFNSRIASLLELTGLQNRMVSDLDAALNGADFGVDWHHVNGRLNDERSRSVGFIKESVFC